MSTLTGRLVRAARVLVPAAMLGWLATVAIVALSAGVAPSPHLLALMAGGYGLGAWLVLALLLVPLSFAISGEPGRASFGRRDFAALGITAAIAALVVAPLRHIAWELIPERLAYPDELAHAISLYAAATVGALVSWIIWRARRREPAAYPLWTFAVIYCAARTAAVPALQLVAPGREGLMDAALMAVLGAAMLGVAGRLNRVARIAVSASWALCVVILLTTLGRAPGARAALFSSYPGSATLVHGIRGLIDMDGDGASAVLGGGDCDDLEPTVHPLALEVAADGIDQNCNGFDPKARGPSAQVRARADAVRKSIVLITADTVRADLLTERVMPRVAALAKGSAVFENSYASAPYTAGSLTSMMSGHTALSRALPWGEDAGSEPTLAEHLHAIGYDTTMIMLDWWGGGERWTIHRGFERVGTLKLNQQDSYRAVTGPEVTSAVLPEIARLTTQAKPFLLWVHYLDPHAEYVPRSGTPFSEGEDLHSRYLQEVWATDHEIGRIIDALEAARFFDDGLLVVHSDHGELVESEGRTGHAYWLAEDVLRTVLLIRGAGIPSGVQRTRVRLFDLAPTLLDFAAGLEAPSFGRSLRPVLEGREREDREAVSYSSYQGASQSALNAASYKLIEDYEHGISYLYNLARDAREQHNLVDSEPAVAARLHARLAMLRDTELNDTVLEERSRRSLAAMCQAGDTRACSALGQ